MGSATEFPSRRLGVRATVPEQLRARLERAKSFYIATYSNANFSKHRASHQPRSEDDTFFQRNAKHATRSRYPGEARALGSFQAASGGDARWNRQPRSWRNFVETGVREYRVLFIYLRPYKSALFVRELRYSLECDPARLPYGSAVIQCSRCVLFQRESLGINSKGSSFTPLHSAANLIPRGPASTLYFISPVTALSLGRRWILRQLLRGPHRYAVPVIRGVSAENIAVVGKKYGFILFRTKPRLIPLEIQTRVICKKTYFVPGEQLLSSIFQNSCHELLVMQDLGVDPAPLFQNFYPSVLYFLKHNWLLRI